VAWVLGSFTQSYLGRGDEAIRRANQAMRLSPLDRGRFYCQLALSLGHYVQGRYAEAVRYARLSRAEHPGFTSTLRYLAAALVAAGERDEAHKVSAEIMLREPKFALRNYSIPFQNAALTGAHRERLRAAGLPE
jgi:adenylate cyclase